LSEEGRRKEEGKTEPVQERRCRGGGVKDEEERRAVCKGTMIICPVPQIPVKIIISVVMMS